MGGPKSAFSIVGEVSETVADVATRANIYLEDATKLARWHAELLAEDLASRYDLESALRSVRVSLEGVDRAMALADPETPNRLAQTGARVLQQQAEALMRDVDAQRVATLDHLTSERRTVLEAIRAERLATLADLRCERLETLAEIEALRRRTLEDGAVLARAFVDHAVWRLGQLLVALVAVGGAVALVVALALGRRRRAEDRPA